VKVGLSLRCNKINEDRLYRALDALLPHKEALEVHLKERLGELFNLEYDLLLYEALVHESIPVLTTNRPSIRV
jgi:hypothetical protein